LPPQAANGDAQAMRLLLQSGAEPSLAAEDGCTALMAAALARSKECVTLLLDAGADVGARNADGRTVLDELGGAIAAMQDAGETAEAAALEAVAGVVSARIV
jgi:hypothetical protein